MPGSTSKAIHRKAGAPPCRDWNTQRWAWLDAVHSDRGVSDRARLLADVLCRRLANNETGLCIHKLDYVADQLRKSKRTTQRALQELEQRGWVRANRRCGRSGFVRFHFENVAEASQITRRKKVTDLSSRRSEKVTNQTQNHDRSDAPNIEPNINQNTRARGASVSQRVPEPHFVLCDDAKTCEEWDLRLRERGLPPLETLVQKEMRAGEWGYLLPTKFPANWQHEDRIETEERFFENCRRLNTIERPAVDPQEGIPSGTACMLRQEGVNDDLG